jgi:hypothetical protein
MPDVDHARREEVPMPTIIFFANGEKREVLESPKEVAHRLYERAPVCFEIPGDDDKPQVIYVYTGQITFFEDAPAREGRDPQVAGVPR